METAATAAAATSAAYIVFSRLQGFPSNIAGKKIETIQFLKASDEVVEIIRTLGTLFTAVVSDMKGNITRISKTYEKDCNKYKYLEDLIANHANADDKVASAILWLKRSLQMVCTFFENIYHDVEQNQQLKTHLQDAYERTLKPYHGFLVQKTFKLIYNWMPSRSQLIGEGSSHMENMQSLKVYLPTLRELLNRLDKLLLEHRIDTDGKL